MTRHLLVLVPRRETSAISKTRAALEGTIREYRERRVRFLLDAFPQAFETRTSRRYNSFEGSPFATVRVPCSPFTSNAVHVRRCGCLLAYWSAHDSSFFFFFFLFASISFLIPIFTSNTCIVLFSAYNYNVLRLGVVYLTFFHALRLLFLVASSRPAATHPSVWIAYKKTRNVKQRAFDDESTTNRRHYLSSLFPLSFQSTAEEHEDQQLLFLILRYICTHARTHTLHSVFTSSLFSPDRVSHRSRLYRIKHSRHKPFYPRSQNSLTIER